jgi:hypothetical protein
MALPARSRLVECVVAKLNLRYLSALTNYIEAASTAIAAVGISVLLTD